MTLRTRLLLVFFGGAILPLALLGAWLLRSAEGSGEVLLAARLDESLQEVVQDLAPRWVATRGRILSMLESEAAQRAFRARPSNTPNDSILLHAHGDANDPLAGSWVLRRAAEDRWSLRRAGPLRQAELTVRLTVFRLRSAERLGAVDVALPAAELIPLATGGSAGTGTLLAAFEPDTRASLLPLPFAPELLHDGRFRWSGEQWLTRFRAIDEPRLVLGLAAPLTPYTAPLAGTARRGALALAVIAALASILVLVFTRHVTHPLATLATGVQAVARGDLERTVPEQGVREVRDVARAFNTMTQSLRVSLEQLARQRGLARVGEFAASLAHEVRNPLSALRVELQSLDEETGTPERVRAALDRSLRQVQRLEATVTGALRVARGEPATLEPIDLLEPLRSAWRTSHAEFDTRGVVLQPLEYADEPVQVRADPAALEQLFLNLLLNAAQALHPGGTARGDVHVSDEYVEVRVIDDGCGIDKERLATIFEPMVSTRSGGTGLGLTIARRIAQAHGGDIMVESGSGAGTTIRVQLPRVVHATT